MFADLIFKEKSKNMNIRKGMFLNINCLHFVENITSKSLLASNFFGEILKFPDFSNDYFHFL